MGFKLWLEQEHPDVLYHHSSPRNRGSILQLGISQKFSQTYEGNGIFLTDSSSSEGNFDIWAVDVRGLELEEDYNPSTDPPYSEENWWVCWDDIPSSRLKLHSVGGT